MGDYVSMPELSCWKKDMLIDPTAPEAVEQSWTECRNVASCRLPNTVGISVVALAYIFLIVCSSSNKIKLFGDWLIDSVDKPMSNMNRSSKTIPLLTGNLIIQKLLLFSDALLGKTTFFCLALCVDLFIYCTLCVCVCVCVCEFKKVHFILWLYIILGIFFFFTLG